MTLNAIIDLTDEQVRELAPLFDEVSAAARLTKREQTEQRYAVLGQAWSPDDVAMGSNAGCAKFYLLSTAQFKIVNKAIVKALKLTDDSPNDIS